MGICYSYINAKREHDNGRNLHLKSKKGSFHLFSKLSGGGGAAAATVALVEESGLYQIPGRLFTNGTSHISSLVGSYAEWEAKLNSHQNSVHENGDAELTSHVDNFVDGDGLMGVLNSIAAQILSMRMEMQRE
ncbi:unnamed protein product [Fraxinus pennsylvanica]|uniref:Uncharacterized protein n=1 Tax=Fraxinus pennsylvanica TaxID=56036 RepID=A0AAD2DJY2_9LAMI|nr:unnamed protein product [Fraxinus pennsylvanica]